MSLLDPTNKTIIGTMSKLKWKDRFRGVNSSLDLKDKDGANLGIFQIEKNDDLVLYNSDGTILLRLIHSGIFRKKVEIRDSKNNFLAKINRKIKLTTGDLYWVENSKEEKILNCKSGFTIPFLDQNENSVAELKLERFKTNFMLSIHDVNFNRTMILGLAFELFAYIKWDSGSGTAYG